MAPAPQSVSVSYPAPGEILVVIDGQAEDHQAEYRECHGGQWSDWQNLSGLTMAGSLEAYANVTPLAAGDAVEARARGLAEPGVVQDAGSSDWVHGSYTEV